MAKLRITYNAPVVLTFALAAVVVQLLGDTGREYFVSWPHFAGWRSYFGLVAHILGHANWDHLLSNFTIILLVGPILEERHGSVPLLMMIGITAIVTGLFNIAFTHDYLLGASGIAFMFVILASMANIKHGEIPLTFIAVAALFMGREVIAAFHDDHISQMAHLVGGCVGAGFGFLSARHTAASAPRPILPPVPTTRTATKASGKSPG